MRNNLFNFFIVTIIFSFCCLHGMNLPEDRIIEESAISGQKTAAFDDLTGLTGDELKNALSQRISQNTNTNYSAARLYMHGTMDNEDGQVQCVYTGAYYPVEPGSMPETGVLDAEHIYCQSWFSGNEEQARALADLHALAPTYPPVNNSRGNHPLGYVESIHTTWGSGDYLSYLGQNADGNPVFEPADEFKGNAARAILYFHVRYNEPFVQPESDPGNAIDMLPELLFWHILDPVDEREARRNHDIELFQKNRNPFVDEPSFVSAIWGPIKPPAPVVLPASHLQSDSFRANWNPSPAAVSYQLDVSAQSDFSSFLPDLENLSVDGTFYDVHHLQAGKVYYYRVRAFHPDAEAPGENSNYMTVTLVNEIEETFCETFNNFTYTGQMYTSGQFTGEHGVVWYYEGARNQSDYPIDGNGMILGSAGDNSRIHAAISGGIHEFSVQMRKAFTGSNTRQIELLINGIPEGWSIQFGGFTGADETVHLFSVNQLDIQGDFVLEIRNVQGGSSRSQVTIDNIRWTPFTVNSCNNTWQLYQ